MRMHELTAKFSKTEMTREQKECMFELQDRALSVTKPMMMNSLEQSDAEEALAEWMEGGQHRECMETGSDAGFDRSECELNWSAREPSFLERRYRTR